MAYLKQTLGVIIGVGQVLADSLCPFPVYEMAAYRAAEEVMLHVLGVPASVRIRHFRV